MTEIWDLLSIPRHQEIAAWLAGGVCAAISMVWALLVQRRARRAAEQAGTGPATPVYPRGVWAFAIAGLALIALSFALGGERPADGQNTAAGENAAAGQ